MTAIGSYIREFQVDTLVHVIINFGATGLTFLIFLYLGQTEKNANKSGDYRHQCHVHLVSHEQLSEGNCCCLTN